MPSTRPVRPTNIQIPPRNAPTSHDHVNEVHFDFLDGAPDTPSVASPPIHPSVPLTPSLRAIRPALALSPTGSPTSLLHLLRILVFLVLLGIIPSTFVFLIDYSVHSIFLIREDTIKPGHGTSGVLLYVASGVALCLASTFVCHVFSPEAEGSGIPAMKSLMSGFYDRQKPALSLWALLAKTIGLVCAIGGGLPVGWEGPNVHISCILAHHLSRLPPFRALRRDRALRMQIMACACAVGLASSFGTPIGGVLYALETTSSFYLVPTFWKCVLSTLAGSLVYDLLYKTPVVEAFQNTTFTASTYKREQLFAFTLLGALLGLLGAFFVRCVHSVYVLRKNRMPGSNRYVLLTVVGIITALLQYPKIWFRHDSRQVINQFFSAESMEKLKPLDVAILILIKFPLIVVSVGLPVPAGVFIPCFLLGSGLGRLYGEMLRALFGSSVVPGGFAVVGAAAFTAGVTRALSVAVVIFEVTGQLEHMVPTLAAVLIAVIVSNGINRSLYDTLIIMKQLPYMPHMRKDRLPTQKVHEIMRTDVVSLNEISTLGRVRTTLDKYPLFDSFPIATDSGLFLGAVRRRTLISVLNRRIPVDVIGEPSVPVVSGPAPAQQTSQLNGGSVDTNLKTAESSPTSSEIFGDLGDAPRQNADIPPIVDDADDDEGDEGSSPNQQILVPARSDTGDGGRYGEDTRVRLEPDLSPLVVTDITLLSQLHFMFVMLMPTHAYVLTGGIFQGIVTRGDLVQSGEFSSSPRIHRSRRTRKLPVTSE